MVIDARLGERENKHINVLEAHGLRNVHLYEGEDWVHIRDAVPELAKDFLVLNEVYPKGFHIPKRFLGENIIHMPTVKTHVFTTTTGAMKNAFGGLLNEYRHWTHPVIHETLVDLLAHSKGDPPGPVRSHGRHLCRRWSGPALHDPLCEKRDPCQCRPGGDRRGLPPS